MRLSIAEQFSDAPWGRYPSDGDFCGEHFREKLLWPALKSGGEVEVSLDRVEGFGSSFLDEAFGGLVTHGYLTAGELKRRLKIVAANPDFDLYVRAIWRYITEAEFNSKRLATA